MLNLKLKLKAYSILELMVSLGIFAILSVMLVNTLVLNIQIAAKINARTRVRSELATLQSLIERDFRSATNVGQASASQACKNSYSPPTNLTNRCDFRLVGDYYWTNGCGTNINAVTPGQICKRKKSDNSIQYLSSGLINVDVSFVLIANNTSSTSGNSIANVLVTLTASSTNSSVDGVVNQVRQFSGSTRNYTVQ